MTERDAALCVAERYLNAALKAQRAATACLSALKRRLKYKNVWRNKSAFPEPWKSVKASKRSGTVRTAQNTSRREIDALQKFQKILAIWKKGGINLMPVISEKGMRHSRYCGCGGLRGGGYWLRLGGHHGNTKPGLAGDSSSFLFPGKASDNAVNHDPPHGQRFRPLQIGPHCVTHWVPVMADASMAQVVMLTGRLRRVAHHVREVTQG